MDKIDKVVLKRIVVSTIGVILIMIGLSFVINSGAGADSVNLFYDGMSKSVGKSIGFWTTVFGSIMFVIAFILDRKKLGYTTIIYLLLAQIIIDEMSGIINTPDKLWLKIVFCLIGVVITSIGCGMCVVSQMGLCVFDAFTFAIPSHFHFNFVLTRWIIEIIFVIVGVLLKGQIGIGTIICTVAFGPTIQFFASIFKKPIYKFTGMVR